MHFEQLSLVDTKLSYLRLFGPINKLAMTVVYDGC